MSIENIIYKKIGERLKRKREELGYTQSEIGSYELTFIDRNIVSKIERGELFKSRKTFITEDELDIFSSVYKIRKGEIVFGKEREEVEVLIYDIYMYIAYNFKYIPAKEYWNEYCNCDGNINPAARRLETSFHFSALYSFFQIYIEKSFESKNYNKLLSSKLIEIIKKNYDKLVNYFWCMCKKSIIKNFEVFFNSKSLDMKNLRNTLVNEWVNKEFYHHLNTIIRDCKKYPIYNVGYNITDELIENAQDMLDYYKFEIDDENDEIQILRSYFREQEQLNKHINRIEQNTVSLYLDAFNQEQNLNIYK